MQKLLLKRLQEKEQHQRLRRLQQKKPTSESTRSIALPAAPRDGAVRTRDDPAVPHHFPPPSVFDGRGRLLCQSCSGPMALRSIKAAAEEDRRAGDPAFDYLLGVAALDAADFMFG